MTAVGRLWSTIREDGLWSTTRDSRLWSMIREDVQLQYRYGFYAVYALLTLVFVLGVRQVPSSERVMVLIAVLFGDQGFAGFYFVGSLVLFEKRENVLDALVTSPLQPREYLVSKVVSLSVLALAASTTITLATHGIGFDPLLFLAGMGLTSILFVFVGFVAVSRFDTLNAYFLTALAYTLPLAAPLLDHFGIVTHPLLYLLPSQASLVVLEAAFTSIPAWELGYGLGYLTLWCGVAYWYAKRAFVRHIVKDHGGQTTPDRHETASDSSGLLTRWEFGPIVTLSLSDLSNWLRDPMLVYIGVSPLLLALLGRWGLPALTDTIQVVHLASYYPLIVAGGVMMPPATFGFVSGFFALEERDSGVLTALRLTPLTGRGYLLYRGVIVVVVSILGSLAVVPLLGLVAVPLPTLLPVAVVASLWGLVAGLILVSNASDTVEGVAISKLLGFLVMIPTVGIAFVPEPWQFLFGLFPAYWPQKALIVSLAGTASPWPSLLAGVVTHTLGIAVLRRRFSKRVDS